VATAPMSTDNDIVIDVIGDSGPFSLIGKSIGYRIIAGGLLYLVDCGAPVFQLLGLDGIQKLRGIVATHSHEDHRRWFTDLALFKRYTPGCRGKLRLISSHTIHDEFHKNSKGALERSLSADSRQVVDMPYDGFVEKIFIGPKPRYHISYVHLDNEQGVMWRVVDEAGELVSPERAKVFINPSANRPRLLFRDPPSGLWIEPETYYSFKNRDFYQHGTTYYEEKKTGLRIDAIKDPAWHGPPTIALRFTLNETSVVFSSDTVYDPELWLSLVKERRPQKLDMSRQEFNQAPIILGNINDYIEQTWSEERYQEACRAYDNAAVIHDVDYSGSIVHTSYWKIEAAKLPSVLLTHSPDSFASRLPLMASEKSFRINGTAITEITEHGDFPMNADCYIKDKGQYLVGYRNPEGGYAIIAGDKCLVIKSRDEVRPSEILATLDLYEDLRGGYYPKLKDEEERYYVRPDGKIELLRLDENGSTGTVVVNCRALLRNSK